ncbi:MAG: hypothetical protein HFI37_01360 [Lachnospiraceae bacterium]|nr:hypothetical protein [Lachnospiraceae bacterium]
MFPILTVFIIFLLYYAYKRNQLSKQESEKDSSFWERENKANTTLRKDIEHLDYIQIPLDTFPMNRYPSKQRDELEKELTALSKEKILNLTGISNTDLKLKYGVANLEQLSACDDNFARLVRLLTDYASTLIEDSHSDDAIPVLEFGVKIKSDVTSNYVMLAELYLEKGEAHRIRSLIETAGLLNSLSKNTIQKKLKDIL